MKYPLHKFVLAFLDFIVVCLSFSAAMQLRGISKVGAETWYVYVRSPEFSFYFLYSLLIIFIFQSNNLYKVNVFLSRSRQLAALVISFFYAVIGLALIAFFVHSSWVVDSRLAVLYFALISFCSTAICRILVFRPAFRYVNSKKLFKTNTLIVGTNLEAKTFALKIRTDNIYGLQLVGFVDDAFPLGTRIFDKYKVLGRVRGIPRLAKELGIKEIIVSVSDVSHAELLRILDTCKKCEARVRVTSSLFEIIHKKTAPELYYDIPVAHLRNPSDDKLTFAMKRVFDIFGSLIALAVLFLPMVAIAVAIKLTSKGSILYTQVRVGKNGKRFEFYKFRSMYGGSDGDPGRVQRVQEFIRNSSKNHGNGSGGSNGSTKVVNENMVTPIGKLIRRTSMDELPQLFNVHKGEMTLVGPRPCLPYEYDAYSEWHK
ncbi:MAG: sugar transferase, partial [Ignavibacteriales bacterium]|nr:sugar transferase [Ignavibacteriales bacterium]